MTMNSAAILRAAPTAPAGPANPPETPAHRKLRKAAQEFEGMLLSQLLKNFNLSLTSLAGDGTDAGASTLNTLAVQTFANAIAARGGFGFAKMLVHQLEPGLRHAK